MAIIRWNPFSFDRFFEDDFDLPTIPLLSRAIGQGLNLYETENEIVAEAAMPGIPEDRIDVTVDKGVVRLSGTTERKDEETKNRKYYMSQMNTSFNYAFRLPDGVTDAEPTCEVSDGVLMVRFPKAKQAPPKKLKVTRRSPNGKNKSSTK